MCMRRDENITLVGNDKADFTFTSTREYCSWHQQWYCCWSTCSYTNAGQDRRKPLLIICILLFQLQSIHKFSTTHTLNVSLCRMCCRMIRIVLAIKCGTIILRRGFKHMHVIILLKINRMLTCMVVGPTWKVKFFIQMTRIQFIVLSIILHEAVLYKKWFSQHISRVISA